MHKIAENHLKAISIASLLLLLFSIVGVYLIFTAEGFVQDVGKATSIMAYNRDTLVAAKPYLVALLTASIVVYLFTLYRLFLILKR